MKKFLSILFTITLISTLAFVFSSCNNSVSFNVNFMVDGEVYNTVSTEGKETITIPENPTKEGYTFDGWYWDNETWQTPFTANSLLDAPLSSDMSVYAKWSASANTAYKVEYYFENLTQDGYELHLTDNLTGTTDTTAEANIKTFEHFTYAQNNANNVLSGNIDGNGTLVLKVYYTRNTYTVITTTTSHLAGSVSSSGTYPYGTEITVTATANPGYTFNGWFNGENKVSDNSSYKFNVNANLNLIAKIEINYNVENFTFEFTETTCTITGIRDKTVSEIIIPDYVTGIGDYAFEDCSRLTSITIPNSVTSIGKDAFRDCTSLTNITIPNSVTSIGDFAFYDCSRLESITIPFVGATKDGTSNTHFGYIFGSLLYSNNSTCVPSSLKTVVITGGSSIDSNAFYGCSSLTSITIPDSVTTIGASAFEGCSNIQSITIPFVGATKDGTSSTHFGYIFGASSLYSNDDYVPSSLKTVVITDGSSIGSDAFYNCYNLTSITIPNSVTYIGDSAFSGCSSLVYNEYDNAYYLGNYTNPYIILVKAKSTSITSCNIQEDTKFIYPSAFSGCSSLISITIPNSVTSIGSYAFKNCSKLFEVINHSSLDITKGSTYHGNIAEYALEIHNGESKIVNKDDYLFYTYNGTNYLIAYVGNDTELLLPQNYNGENYDIYNIAFSNCSRLTNITIPNSVTSIGYGAFSNCSKLESITIPNSVTSIAPYAFYGCSSLQSMTIPFVGATKGGTSNTYFGYIFGKSDYSHWGYYIPSSLKNVVITGGSNIYSYAFYDCDNLTSITIPNSVTSIGDYAFYDCDNLTSITIPNSVTYIGSSAFSGCSSLVYNEYDNAYYLGNDTNPYLLLVDAKSTSITSCNISEDTKFIYPSAFSGCSNLTSITIPNSVTSIENYVFSGCSKLTSVTIPNSVTSIDYEAFSGCSSLTSITIPNSVTSIENYAFEYCSKLTSVIFEENSLLESIYSCAFYKCDNLTSVTIPNNVTYIGSSAFYGCSSLVYNEYDNAYYLGNDTNPYILLVKAKSTDITSCNINENTKFIYGSAFFGCSSLTSITIPNSVTSIGDRAFYNCSSLTNITIPNSVTSIGADAFSGCSSLTSITIPNSVTSIDVYAFSGCSSLTNITIPNGVTSISYGAFYGCSSLTSITIPNSVTSIGSYAFSDCYNLTSITIPNSVTSIDVYAFSGCSSLTSVKFENASNWITTFSWTLNGSQVTVNISSSSLEDKSTAATYLKETYCDYTWTRSE